MLKSCQQWEIKKCVKKVLLLGTPNHKVRRSVNQSYFCVLKIIIFSFTGVHGVCKRYSLGKDQPRFSSIQSYLGNYQTAPPFLSGRYSLPWFTGLFEVLSTQSIWRRYLTQSVLISRKFEAWFFVSDGAVLSQGMNFQDRVFWYVIFREFRFVNHSTKIKKNQI